jgi:hypothetical protein
MSVVNLNTERERREAAAWAAYVSAKDLADRSRNIEDGKRAARAWCAFLELYQTPAQSEFMGATVSTFGRRA